MSGPSFKDVEVLEKFATKLCVPFFAVASVLQPPDGATIPHWLVAIMATIVKAPRDSPTAAVLIATAIWSLIWAVCCTLFLWFMWGIRILVIGYSWVEWLGPVLLPASGLIFISMGALALCKIPTLQTFAVHDPLPSLNVFWEVGLFTFGLWCIQLEDNSSESTLDPATADRKHNHRTKLGE